MRAAIVVLWLALATHAAGAVERFAVVIGNNAGAKGDVELRYAEDDATKVANVLTSLGGFPAENVVVLDGKSADDARRALITVNDRIRNGAAGDTMLLVYYSGHATSDDLHLGGSTFALPQLESLVRGSSATMRILILDACRSGSLTRVKGGKSGAQVTIALDDKLSGEGIVFLTASSANEDAQESDELRGSFFTHYFVSALLGAGDENADGAVSLEEAYRSAYDAVLRASSQTLALQHPTFHFDVKGQGDLVLTRLADGSSRRGKLAFPDKRTYLVFRGGKNGAVVAEVSTFDKHRQISLEAGTYFVRGRDSDFALEGTVEVVAGQDATVDDAKLKRLEYARLVRKGLAPKGHVTSIRAGYFGHTALAEGDSLCQGAFAGAAMDFTTWSFEGRFAGCHDGFANDTVMAKAKEFGLEGRLGRPFDVGRVAIVPAVVVGAALVDQKFTTRGEAPEQRVATVHLGAATSVICDLGWGFHTIADVAAETYIFDKRLDDEHTGVRTAFAVRVGLGVGKWF